MTNVDKRCSGGERRVFEALKRCLDDDFLVWHNVPIGPKARQPDFVILSPRWGVLLLEVKDWKPSTLGRASRDAVEIKTERGSVTTANPIRQARDYTLELVDLMQRDPALVHESGPHQGKLLFPYGWGAVFSNIKRSDFPADQFDQVFPANQTLLREDLDEADTAKFQERLYSMFTVHYRTTLSLPQRDRIRWHLFPEIRITPTQGSLALGVDCGEAQLPDLMQVMDLQQEQIARTLGEGHRVIHGSAGSGKTMILTFRAEQLAAAARPDKPILVLCYNRALAGRIDSILRQRGVDERVVVRTFHSWCEDMVRTYQLKVPVNRKARDYFEKLAETTSRAVDTGLVPAGQYVALLIDEAHDFEDAWLAMAARMVDPATNSLLVLYDDAQSIYQKKRRKFNFASVGIEARGRTSILKLNYRNTAEVLSLAVNCAERLLDRGEEPDSDLQTVKPATAGRRGPLPVLVEATTEQQEAELLAQRVAAALERGMAPNEIAVLCRTKFQMPAIERALARRNIAFQSMSQLKVRDFEWNGPSVKLVTLHSSKGLEFPVVFVAGLQAMPHKDEPLEEEVRLLYVGMTRANQELVLSTHGDSPIVQRVRSALVQVSQQLAA
ncbi:MAG TPA: 3'-5' exonuclease [Burkholderiaceae bacterium]|nr:3'-5' exonuclease [Burkholderiaceae bacterium]